jgi:thiol:disulfide interchange protein DsbD
LTSPHGASAREAAKVFFGLVFLGAAVWMVSRILSGPSTLALWAMCFIGSGVWIGAFDLTTAHSSGRRRVAKAAGLAGFAYGITMAVGAAGGAGDPLRRLGPMMPVSGTVSPDDFAIVRDREELTRNLGACGGRPSLVHVTADWCATCAAIERTVLSHAGVRAVLAGFDRIKLDVTDDDREQQEMRRSLRVAGPPTMFFLDESVSEVPGSRLIGDVTVGALLAAAGKADPQ